MGFFCIEILLLKFGPHFVFEISLCKLDKIIVSIGSKCWSPRAKCMKNVRLHSSTNFFIIQALVLHHTCIGLCKYCNSQKIVVESSQRPVLVAFCNILLRYVSLVEACPLCKSCKNYGYNYNCLQCMASGVCMSKQFLR